MVENLKNNVDWLKGCIMEFQVRDRVGAFFGKLHEKARLIDTSELADTLYEVVAKMRLSEEDPLRSL